MSNRKVVTELSKLWDTVASKGKLAAENRVHDIKSWVSERQSLNSFQLKVSAKYDQLNKFQKQITAEDVAEKTRLKVGRLMTAYEEFIGMNEVRSAHARVLTSEAKFIECQGDRRLASKELSEIHNKLMEIRTELDRTQRGDESYLDLIKQEIAVTKQERIIRKHFEELERTEREVFAELSGALRFSHEKERAQNEKTKYWSIVGSIVGAGLGVLASTINNRMKQNHIKNILEESSAHVKDIQNAVEQLSQKINASSFATADGNHIVQSDRSNVSDMFRRQEELTNSLQKLIKTLQQVIVSNHSHQNEQLTSDVSENLEIGLKKQVMEHRLELTVATLCMLSILVYKFVMH